MSYTSRHRYKSRRERFKQIKRKTLIFLIFAAIAIIILIYKNWQSVYDQFIIYFG